MGIGLAMTEMPGSSTEIRLARSFPGTGMITRFPRPLDVPADIASLPIDSPDNEANTTGAKGLGEPVTIPTAAAVANAICQRHGLEADIDAGQPRSCCAGPWRPRRKSETVEDDVPTAI